MAQKDDKWVMFRNYMHNELGITKEDIRRWIEESIEFQVRQLVYGTYGKVDIEEMIRDVLKKELKFDSNLREQLYEKVVNSIQFKN